jgi:hypothetical protein
MRYVQTPDTPDPKSHEYMALSKSNRDELVRGIPELEKTGWELLTITESSVSSRGAAVTTFTAWMRKL